MRLDRDRHQRRSIRLRHHDYSAPGVYFITIVAQDRVCLFGEIAGGQMHLNAGGRLVGSACDALSSHYPEVGVDSFVVMPNHIHAILILKSALIIVGSGRAQGPAPTLSLGDVVGRLKTITTKQYIESVRAFACPPFRRRLWQRNYFEHVIRDNSAHARIMEYIANNPARWVDDPENPEGHARSHL